MSEESLLRVQDVMRASVITIGRMSTVQEALDLLDEHRVSSLVVERKNADDEYGMILISDIARQVISPNKSPERTNVYEVMSKPVMSLPPEMTIRNAIRLLVQFSISRALVVDKDREPIGIVTLRDMVLRHASPRKA